MNDERKNKKTNRHEAALVAVVGIVAIVLLIGTGTSVFGSIVVGAICLSLAAALALGVIK